MYSKKIRILLMSFVLLVSFVFSTNSVFAEDLNNIIYISKYSANYGRNIYPGDKFELEIQIKNDSAEIIHDVWIEFADSSFQPIDGGKEKPFADSIGGIPVSKTFNMVYTGGNNKNLSFTVVYTLHGQTYKVPRTIWIDNAIPESTTDMPVLQILSGDIPVGWAGGNIVIPLTISNVSTYEAREIKITPVLEGDVFTVDQVTVYRNIEKIQAGKSTDIDFKFTVNKNAKAGTYKIPLKIEYKVAHGVDYKSQQVDIYVKISEEHLPPRLVVREVNTKPAVIKPGEDFTLDFVLWNMGTLEATNLSVDLNLGDNFSAADNLTAKFFQELKGVSSLELNYRLKAGDKLKSGSYPVTLKFEYDGGNLEYPVYVIVEGDDSNNADIVTGNVNAPQQAVSPEETFAVGFDVINTGSSEAKDIKVTVESGDRILPKSLNVLTINSLGPGESAPVNFSFIATKDAENKVYPIKVTIEYKNGDEQVKKEQYIGVMVEKEEESTLNTVPKIIISEYSSDPAMVKAGENFTLHLTFLNTSKVKAVVNMKINLVVNETGQETKGNVFTPVQSSNTFYIDRLEPGESADKTVVMYTVPDAQAKTYVVTAVFEYEYEENGQLKTNKMEDVFGIPVIQPAKLEVTEVIVSEPAYVGEPLYISSEFYNMGRVKLSNLMVKVESDDFDTREANYFVGNFEIGASDYYEAAITPLKPGESRGKVVYTFEDAAGEEYRIEKEFTVNVMEAAPVINPFPGFDNPGDFRPGMEMPGEKASKFPVIPVVIGGVVLVGIVVLIIVLKRRKKRKELMLDEDI